MNEWIEAEQRVERAHQMYRSGRWEEALRELRAALEIQPEQGEWHFNMGLTLEALGRHTQAAGCYRRAAERCSHQPDIFNHLGAACLRAGRAGEAIEAFEQAARLDPASQTPYVYRIEAYRQLGDHDNAETMFYAACQIDDAHPRTYLLMAQSLLDRGMAQRAIACLERVKQLDRRDPDLHAHLGEAYRMQGDLERARREYARQVRLFPTDAMALLELGRVLAELGEPIEAAVQLRRAAELDGGCADAHFELGRIALEADHSDAAQLEFEAVLRLDPAYRGAHQNLAVIALRRQQTRQARRHLAAELALLHVEPAGDRQDVEELSSLLMDAGMQRESMVLLRDLVDRAPGDAELWHQLAAACFLAGELAAGLRYGRRAVGCDEQHLPAIQNMVVAHLRLAELGRARYWLTRAQQIDPEDPLTRQLRGQLWVRGVAKYFRWRVKGR